MAESPSTPILQQFLSQTDPKMSHEKQTLDLPLTYEHDISTPNPRSGSPIPPPEIQRRGSESSNEREDYGDEKFQMTSAGLGPTQSGSAPPHYRELGFYHTKRMRHVIIVDDATHQAVYFVDVSEFRRGQPDVVLRDVSVHPNLAAKGKALTVDEGRSCPIIHIAKWSALSRDMKLGLGGGGPRNDLIENFATAPNLQWEEVKCLSKVLHSTYGMTLRDPKTGQPTSYVFERTHSKDDGLEQGSIARNLALNNYRLTNQNTGEVTAIFLTNMMKSWLKSGKLRIYASDMDKSLEQTITLAYCAILEKARRRANYRSSGGGGNGGGGGGGGC